MADINKYSIENLPITEETYKELTKENIYQIGVIGRMLSVQDNVYEEQAEKILSKLDKLISAVSSLSKRMSHVEKILQNHETRIDCLEKRMEKVEKLIA